MKRIDNLVCGNIYHQIDRVFVKIKDEVVVQVDNEVYRKVNSIIDPITDSILMKMESHNEKG